MKKIFTSCLIFLSGLLGYSQSIVLLNTNDNVVTNTIVDVYIGADSTVTTTFLVHNSTNVSRSYKVRRAIITMAADDSTQFCWGGSCYNFSTNLSSQSATVAAMDTIDATQNGFHCIFVAGSSSMTRLVNYHFFDPNNPLDSNNVTVRYNPSVGINEISKQSSVISNVYPNPASSSFSIKYDIVSSFQKSKIIIYDVLGNQVKEMLLNDKKGTAIINTDDLNSGLYFYSLVIDDKIIATKKLVITK